jgi:signal transduction histidine kinase
MSAFNFRCSVAVALWVAAAGQAQPQSESLTNAADVISLPTERAARSLPVVVKGVVTAADPALKGRFFLQDSTGGVFVDNADGERVHPGDVVEVIGITHPGAYAPIITAPQVRKTGTAALPPARPVGIERLMSGAEDSQRIEITGLVRDARVEGARLVVDLVSGGYRFRAYVPISPEVHPQLLIGAQVRVRGTAAESHNRSLRQFISLELYVPGAGDFLIEKHEVSNHFEQPVVALNSLAQYRRDSPMNQRVHVQGVVTLQRLGEGLYLQDASGGLKVHSRQLTVFAQGEVVDAVGFAAIENYLPVLEDAVFRKAGRPAVSVPPIQTSIDEIMSALHHAGFVSLTGKLMDRTVRQVHHQRIPPAFTKTTLVLQNSNVLFTAETDELPGGIQLASIPIGSTLEVRGICVTEINAEGAVDSFRILIGSPGDVRVLERASWWTPQRLFLGLTTALAILVPVAGWSVMVAKKNSMLKVLVREKEQAQGELQRAHDELEYRVRERTAQLKFQITARQEAELQFEAVIAERTRLAQELHDTLEQTLTGIALQMESAAKVWQQESTNTNRHFELARNLVIQGQVEVRRSVWDLRSRALQQFDLSNAIKTCAKELTDGAGVQVEVAATGRVRPVPEVIEDNLLRIAQESLTNIIKHSGATMAKVKLDYGPRAIHLEVEDNGKGFDPANCAGPRDGHFGLLGMHERVARLRGEIALVSTPGHGTVVRVRIPIEPEREALRHKRRDDETK